MDVLPSFSEAKQAHARGSSRFAVLGTDSFVDLVICRARMQLLAEPLLLHANEQAHAAGTSAHVRLVAKALASGDDSSGTSSCHIERLLVAAVGAVLHNYCLEHVAAVEFVGFCVELQSCGSACHGAFIKGHGRSGMQILFAPEGTQPHDAQGNLLVSTVAWTGAARTQQRAGKLLGVQLQPRKAPCYRTVYPREDEGWELVSEMEEETEDEHNDGEEKDPLDESSQSSSVEED